MKALRVVSSERVYRPRDGVQRDKWTIKGKEGRSKDGEEK